MRTFYFKIKAHKYFLWMLVAAFLMLVVAQQLFEPPGTTQLSLALKNAAHTPWFFLLTLLLWQGLQSFTRLSVKQILGWCLLLCVILAVVTEVLQMFTARQASSSDVVLDLLGASSALVLISLIRFWSTVNAYTRVFLFVISISLFVLGFFQVGRVLQIQYQQWKMMPFLLEFSDEDNPALDNLRGNWKVTDVSDDWPELAESKVAEITLSSYRQWPGIRIREPYSNWQGYQWVTINAYSKNVAAIPLTLRVETQLSRGMDSSMELALQPGINKITLPIASLIPDEESLVSGVRNLLLFSHSEHGGKVFFIRDVVLE